MTTNLFRTQFDAATGETKEIPLVAGEIAALAIAAQDAENQRKADEAAEAKQLADKEAIAAKLGLTSAELKALLA